MFLRILFISFLVFLRWQPTNSTACVVEVVKTDCWEKTEDTKRDAGLSTTEKKQPPGIEGKSGRGSSDAKTDDVSTRNLLAWLNRTGVRTKKNKEVWLYKRNLKKLKKRKRKKNRKSKKRRKKNNIFVGYSIACVDTHRCVLSCGWRETKNARFRRRIRIDERKLRSLKLKLDERADCYPKLSRIQILRHFRTFGVLLGKVTFKGEELLEHSRVVTRDSKHGYVFLRIMTPALIWLLKSCRWKTRETGTTL